MIFMQGYSSMNFAWSQEEKYSFMPCCEGLKFHNGANNTERTKCGWSSTVKIL